MSNINPGNRQPENQESGIPEGFELVPQEESGQEAGTVADTDAATDQQNTVPEGFELVSPGEQGQATGAAPDPFGTGPFTLSPPDTQRGIPDGFELVEEDGAESVSDDNPFSSFIDGTVDAFSDASTFDAVGQAGQSTLDAVGQAGQSIINIGQAFGEGALDALAGGETFQGFGLSREFKNQLRESGVFRQDASDFSISRTLNEAVIGSGVSGLDLVSRFMLAPFEGAFDAAEQTAIEFGESPSSAASLKQDLRTLVDTAGIVTGTSPLLSAQTARREAEKVINDFAKRSNILAETKSRFRQQAKRNFDNVAPASDDEALQLARSKIGKESPRALTESADLESFSFQERATASIFDRLRPIRNLAERGAQRQGIPADLTPYRDMRLVAGSRGVFEHVLKRGTVKFNDDGSVGVSGKGLNEIFSPLTGKKNEAMLYFAGRRARELKNQGREELFSDVEIDAMVNLEKANPEFREVFDEFQSFNQRMLDFAEQGGVISASQKQKFTDLGNSFVPFYRAAVDGEGVTLGKLSTGSPLRRLKGSDTALNEIEENIVRNTLLWTDITLRNQAKNNVYNMIEEFGFDDIAKRAPKGKFEFAKVLDDKVKEAAAKSGIDLDEELTGVLSFNREASENVDFVFRNGERVAFEINDPVFRKAMQSFSPRSLGFATQIFSLPANVLRKGVSITPDFMIRNAVKDTEQAFIQSDFRFTPVVDTIRGLNTRVREDENYWNLMRNGGGFATTYAGEVQTGTNLQRIYKDAGLNPGNVLDSPRRLSEFAEKLSSSFEMSSRLGEFRNALNAGETARDAAFAAREISTDFSLRGSSETLKFFTQSIPFLNARMQGLNRIYRAARENPSRTAIKGLTALTIPSLALHSQNRKDPRYQALPDWVKDQHWVLFLPDQVADTFDVDRDQPFMIPKGFETGAVFATMPEIMMNAAADQNGPEFADRVMKVANDMLSVNPIPQAVRPLVETEIANESFFTGAPVIPRDLENVRPSEQFDAFTSDTAVELSQILSDNLGVEVSPKKAEFLTRGYFGSIASHVLWGLDMLARDEAERGERPATPVSEFPILDVFTERSPASSTQFMNDFFELRAASEEVASTVRKMKNEARRPDVSDEELELLSLRKFLRDGSQQSGKISRAIELISNDEDLSAEQKRERMDNLLKQRNELFLQLLQGVPEPVLRREGIAIPAERRSE